MMAFVIVYVCIGMLYEYGWQKYFNEFGIIEYFIMAVIWPSMFVNRDLVDTCYLGWAGEKSILGYGGWK